MNSLNNKDFLSLADVSSSQLMEILDRATYFKNGSADASSCELEGKAVAVILQKPSLRTRISFERAISRLGAQPVMLTGPESAFSRGESTKDTAEVLARYVDAIVIRTADHALIEELAFHSSVPVINALTDLEHPCQGLADLLTIREKFGTLKGLQVVYTGDGSNNMANTYLLAGAHCGMHISIATPEGFQPDEGIRAKAEEIAARNGGSIRVTRVLDEVIGSAQVVITDTFTSMGQEADHDARLLIFSPYAVTKEIMASASTDAIFMHCLPAHRGEEVTGEVIDGVQSVVYDQAENRLHAQQGLLSLLLNERV